MMTELTSNKWTEYRRPGGDRAEQERAIVLDNCIMGAIMAPFMCVIGYCFGVATYIAVYGFGG